MRDDIFLKKNDLVDFTFDASVVNVFDDMVRRSVPGYQSMIEMIGLMVKTYGQNNTNYYDLGASTGATAIALGVNNPHKNNHIIAVDSSIEMTKKCVENMSNKIEKFEVICADIGDITIQNASMVVINLTLQFIKPEQSTFSIDCLLAEISSSLYPFARLKSKCSFVISACFCTSLK
jgi:tRNA (cmo5U34)-methyltransferase